jgi:hypothetical protein
MARPPRGSRASPAAGDDAKLVRQERDELRERDDRGIAEAGAAQRVEGGAVATARIGRQGGGESQHRGQGGRGGQRAAARFVELLFIVLREGPGAGDRADVRGDAQTIGCREALDRLTQQRIVARLACPDDLGAESSRGVQRVAGRKARGAIDHVGSVGR